MPLKNIRNFVPLRPDIGTAGQPTSTQFSDIADQGYEVVINLAMPDHEDAIDNEGEIVTGLGMSYIHIPVPFNNPQPRQVRDFCNILSTQRDKRVFVHCIMNYRVSAFMFHYLDKVVMQDKEKSRSPMFDKWQPDSTWKALLDWTKEEIGL